MKFLLLVEGDTEHKVLPAFIQRWLNARLDYNVGISPVNLRGNRGFRRDIRGKVHFHLNRDRQGEIIAAIGLLDLYKGADFPASTTAVPDRYDWGVRYYEDLVGHAKFRMFFAVHETEAWLLSDPRIFAQPTRRRIQREAGNAPEQVNFDNPPAKRLNTIYRTVMRRSYRKITDGGNLFESLAPDVARNKCPYLAQMLDELLNLAQGAAQGESG